MAGSVRSLFWKTRTSVGLYGIPELKQPEGFRVLTRNAIARTHEMIQHATRIAPSKETILALDDISDTVCVVCDAAELCRHTHPDAAYVREANSAYLQLTGLVQELNCNVPLYRALVAALEVRQAQQAPGGFPREEVDRVGSALRRDFERGGVHLDEEGRRLISRLSLQGTKAGMAFSANLVEPKHMAAVDLSNTSKLHRLPSEVKGRMRAVRGQPGTTRATLDSQTLGAMLTYVDDEDLRRRAFLAGFAAPAPNLGVLDDLLASRASLAAALGEPSHAHFATRRLLAGSPVAATTFLEQLSDEVWARWRLDGWGLLRQ
ncbi:hypothetical protein CYMTET_33120, partial [Cymbomonas tetramitiformis]